MYCSLTARVLQLNCIRTACRLHLDCNWAAPAPHMGCSRAAFERQTVSALQVQIPSWRENRHLDGGISSNWACTRPRRHLTTKKLPFPGQPPLFLGGIQHYFFIGTRQNRSTINFDLLMSMSNLNSESHPLFRTIHARWIPCGFRARVLLAAVPLTSEILPEGSKQRRSFPHRNSSSRTQKALQLKIKILFRSIPPTF